MVKKMDTGTCLLINKGFVWHAIWPRNLIQAVLTTYSIIHSFSQIIASLHQKAMLKGSGITYKSTMTSNFTLKLNSVSLHTSFIEVTCEKIIIIHSTSREEIRISPQISAFTFDPQKSTKRLAQVISNIGRTVIK